MASELLSLRAIGGLLSIVAMLLMGCGASAEPLIPVEGIITYQDRPLATGSISLLPDAARGNKTLHQPTGIIDSAGNYRLFTTSEPGAPAGPYKVIIHATESTHDPKLAHPGMPRSLIPTKYSDPKTTPLSIEVRSDASPTDYHLKLVP